MTLHAILQSRNSDPERRSAARRALRLATAAVAASGTEVNAVVHDLSADGLLIETDAGLQVGETLAVSLPRGGPREATVVWSSSRFFGCRFAAALTPAIVSAALLQAEPETRGQAAEGVPARLSALRQARGLTGEKLAKRVGVSRQALWYWETGRRTPRPEQLAKLAAELGVDEAELRGGAAQPRGGANDAASRANAIQQCRRLVAEQFEVDPAKVRIMVEL